MADQPVDKEMDLPLMANVEEIRVRHYMMQLSFDFDNETVTGEAIIFCQQSSQLKSKQNDTDKNFELILDHRHIDFLQVSEVTDCCSELELILSTFESRKDLNIMKSCFQKPVKSLKFVTEEWCLRIRKEGVSDIKDFPMVVKIAWKTQKQAKSLMWRQDQDGEKCVFTAAASVNNRSLFPCQEPPIAMSTWECLIKTTSRPEFSILCTGDENGQLYEDQYYFYTQMILPMSTFAIAIGSWKSIDLLHQPSLIAKTISLNPCKRLHEPYPCHIIRGDLGPLIPCRLFGSSSLLSKASKLWNIYIPACLESAYELLGSHPFKKLDICIVPRCYSGLGLASPNLMFVSQTLIHATDGGMMIKLSHEIAHNWFGLLIGAKDWTEEWLTEVSYMVFKNELIKNEIVRMNLKIKIITIIVFIKYYLFF